MIIKAIKTTGLSLALAAAFIAAAGSNASAQVPQRFDHDRDSRFDHDRDGRFDTRRERLEERKGFNDGLIKGKSDALAHRRFNPIILQRRFVSNDYREGFQKGYAQAYREFSRNFGHRFGR